MKRWLTVAAIGLLVVLVVTGVAAWLVVTELQTRLHAAHRFDGEVTVVIEPGTSSRGIATQLAAAGVVRDDWLFRLAAWHSERERDLQAGEYRFTEALSPLGVVDVLATGRVRLYPITFPEGLTITEMADLFDASAFGTRDDFLAQARRVELVADLDPEAEDLEGYLFPETYSLPRHATAADLVESMVTQFRRAFDDDLRAEADRQGRTIREVVTLASLIQKETGAESEHTLVSAVYNNRLRIGMGMQCDPTVIYALERDGLYDGNLTRENLQYDSPYNTYRYPGLPPGPIAAPGQAVLWAALHPADVSYVYFVSRNDGTHVFADTLREHNRNVREWQVEYFRRRRGQG